MMPCGATARGSATALKVVAIMLLVCMGILVVQIGVLRLHNESVRLMLLYTLLVFIWAVAAKKRMHVMLECERRGLWQRIFSPARPTRRLLWLGGGLLGLANVLLARYFLTV